MVDTKLTPKNAGKPANNKSKWNGNPRLVGESNFKGVIVKLSTHVFVTGPNQASKYDDAYKHILFYLGNKFNHRVHRAFECKDYAVGLSLLCKPTAPTTQKVVQEATPGDNSMFVGVERTIIDKDSEEYLEYQVELKQYITDKTKYRDDMHKCFNIVMGQCSPAVEQNLEAEETFSNLKNKSDSIGLIKLLEKLCYSYKAHEYTPLGAWNAIDKLSRLIQPEDVHEVQHYEVFRSVIEMCKASGVNFALMCTDNVNTAMKELGPKLSRSG